MPYHPATMRDSEIAASHVLTREHLRQCVIAGAERVIASRDALNRINVFPVPDGDTGTNLAATMRAVLEGLRQPLSSIDAVGKTVALSALSGAQGNSGVILAQFFQGLREGMAGCAQLTVDRFARAVRHAAERAREALAQPREGTILTVMTAVAEHLASCRDRVADFRVLLDEGLGVARRSLAETQHQLAVLRKAGVVDAGALGFVRFLEGIRDHLWHEDRDDAGLPDDAFVPDVLPSRVESEPVDFRYCAEAVVLSADAERVQVQKVLAELGDSVVVAGSAEEIHAHVHSNVPALVFEALEQFGTLEHRKVDDMWRALPTGDPYGTRSGVALVTDSVCDLPTAVLTAGRVQVVPLRVAFGDETLLDRVDITPRQFYERLQVDPAFPTTSQPSPADFLATYRHLAGRFDAILSVHLSADVSGTYRCAEVAARQVAAETGVPIRVVDSRSASAAEGLVVWATLQAIQANLSLEGCARVAAASAAASDTYVYVPTVRYFVRGGRLSPLQGRVASILRILPVLTIRAGRVVSAGKRVGVRSARRRALNLALRRAASMERPIFAVSHSNAPDLVQHYKLALHKRFPASDVLTADAAPALGSHAGPGGATIAVLDAAIVAREVGRS
ncbi:MAG: DegV family protein [Candidatus Bipolaricaulis sp.]|nr:DegV family protein [Candidatus Bipolaricaulis sp.]